MENYSAYIVPTYLPRQGIGTIHYIGTLHLGIFRRFDNLVESSWIEFTLLLMGFCFQLMLYFEFQLALETFQIFLVALSIELPQIQPFSCLFVFLGPAMQWMTIVPSTHFCPHLPTFLPKLVGTYLPTSEITLGFHLANNVAAGPRLNSRSFSSSSFQKFT